MYAIRSYYAKSYGVGRWAEQVKGLRELATRVLENEESRRAAEDYIKIEASKSRTMRDVLNTIELYQLVGHEKNLSNFRIRSGQYSVFDGVKYDPPKTIWTIEQRGKNRSLSNWPRQSLHADTRNELLENFKKTYTELLAQGTPKRLTTFEVYSYRDGSGYFAGKKIGRHPVALSDTFKTSREVRDYIKEHHDELVTKLEKYKEIPSERRDTNNPRVGEDMRNGQDVTPEMFGEAFGFRGVEFGNWVEQKKRQADLNNAYDALMDLAGILNIPPQAISLNGKLGIAFGARGSGGKFPAKAHYEPGKVVINLTKQNVV